ncbi:APC family permease [Streptomyces sp. NPDC091215]|uniref:APC family permease n=1 Tax=Streptomyces sp. NPDC091215 TaxID=3155192 RepID=UPI00343334DA
MVEQPRRERPPGRVALAALLPVYVLLGWEGAADLAEETTAPRRTTPPAMIRAVAVSGAMGLIVFALLAIDLPSAPATFLSGSGNPVLHLVGARVGGVARAIMTVVAFASLFACLIANMAVATRMVFALARDRMLPGSTALASVGRRTGAPVAAILVITALAVVLNLLNAGLVEKIFAMVGLTYYLTYALTLIAAAIAHRKGRIPPAPEGVFGLGRWLWPTLVVGLVWCAAVIVVLTVPEENNQTAVTVVVGVGLGFLWWLFALRRRISAGRAGPPAQAAPPSADPSHGRSTA